MWKVAEIVSAMFLFDVTAHGLTLHAERGFFMRPHDVDSELDKVSGMVYLSSW